ncbi:MAG TPA: hypothetical protein VF668_24700, partial [Pyrinomonadaceae bacterium]
DPALRARVLARAADALWQTDQASARDLFRKAWEAATAADAEAHERYQSRLREARAAAPPPNLRVEILRLASRRDGALGDEFLAALTDDREREANLASNAGDAQRPCPSPTEVAPLAVTQRLALAGQMLSAGEAERATQIAGPALTCVTIPGLRFLSGLRLKDGEKADRLYSALLTRASADAAADANTVSLLSSYVLTPFLYVTVDRKGGMAANQYARTITPPDLPAPLRQAFFNVAAQILLRPPPPPYADKTSAGQPGAYFILARLMPLLAQHVPDRAPALHARLRSLTPDVPESFRSGNHELLTKGLVADNTSRVSPEDLERAAQRLTNSADRDALYASAAISAAQKNDPQARALADKIGDEALRRRVYAFVDFTAVNEAVSRKNVEEVVRLARGGELTDVQRVLALTQAAGLLRKTDAPRAGELVDEAMRIAQRLDVGGQEHVRALISVVTALIGIDRPRAWETLGEVVKAANAAKDFNGDDAQVMSEIKLKDNTFVTTADPAFLDMSNVFTAFAREDMTRAVELARALKGDSPRAVSILAIVRTVLAEKPASASARPL